MCGCFSFFKCCNKTAPQKTPLPKTASWATVDLATSPDSASLSPLSAIPKPGDKTVFDVLYQASSFPPPDMSTVKPH